MDYMSFAIGEKIIILISSLLAIVFGFGVVWRVEKKLDISFKFFLAAIIFFFLGEVFSLFYVPKNSSLVYFVPLGKILFSLFFLAGMVTMHNMIRRIDGEK